MGANPSLNITSWAVKFSDMSQSLVTRNPVVGWHLQNVVETPPTKRGVAPAMAAMIATTVLANFIFGLIEVASKRHYGNAKYSKHQAQVATSQIYRQAIFSPLNGKCAYAAGWYRRCSPCPWLFWHWFDDIDLVTLLLCSLSMVPYHILRACVIVLQ